MTTTIHVPQISMCFWGGVSDTLGWVPKNYTQQFPLPIFLPGAVPTIELTAHTCAFIAPVELGVPMWLSPGQRDCGNVFWGISGEMFSSWWHEKGKVGNAFLLLCLFLFPLGTWPHRNMIFITQEDLLQPPQGKQREILTPHLASWSCQTLTISRPLIKQSNTLSYVSSPC